MSSQSQTSNGGADALPLPSTRANVTNTNTTTTQSMAAGGTCPPIPPRQELHLLTSSSSSSSLAGSTSASSSGILTPTNLNPPTPTEFKTHPKYNCHIPQFCPRTGYKTNVLQRNYPKPKEEVNVEEALARGPLPGRYVRERVAREETAEQKSSEFERMKKELRSWRSS